MKYSAYPNYKDSGVEWLGEIPEHWRFSKLKYDSYIKARVGWHGLTSDELVLKGEAFAVTGSDFLGNSINWKECRKCSLERYKQDKFIQLNDNDLLVTKDGTIGKIIKVGKLPSLATLNSGIFVIRPLNNAYITEYYYWVLLSSVFDGYISFYKTGSTISHLYQDTFCQMPYALPPLQEQQTIANYLDKATAKIDTLIAKQTRLIALLKEKRQAMIDNVIHQESTVEMRLGRVVDQMIRAIHRNKNEQYVALGLYNRGRGIFHKPAKAGEELGDSDFFWIETDDLILSGQFAWEGSVALASSDENNCIVSHRYPVLRGKRGILNTEYLWAFFTTKVGDFILNEHSIGSAGRNRPLNINTLLKEKIPVPTTDMQMKVAKIVKAEKKIKITIDKSIDLLKEKRTALISSAVTGKIKVTDNKGALDK